MCAGLTPFCFCNGSSDFAIVVISFKSSSIWKGCWKADFQRTSPESSAASLVCGGLVCLGLCMQQGGYAPHAGVSSHKAAGGVAGTVVCVPGLAHQLSPEGDSLLPGRAKSGMTQPDFSRVWEKRCALTALQLSDQSSLMPGQLRL